MSGRHEIESRREEIEALCREHQVARLLVFGSVLRDDFDPRSSDIDLLVEFLPGVRKPWGGEHFELEEDMVRLFGRSVDLIPANGIRNPYRLMAIEQNKELLYVA